MNSSERIKAILRRYGLNAKSLAESLGMDRAQAIYDIINGKTRNITEKMADKIISVFSEINKSWLLSGEGEMLQGTVQAFEVKSEEKTSVRRIPVYDMAATAGFNNIYMDGRESVLDYLTIPNLPPVDGAIYARGDSMSPLIESGDIIIFKKVELNPGNILWGNIYIVSYVIDGDDYTVLKYVRQSGKAGHIRLESFNPRYDPQEIPASCVTAMALVKASITFHTIA
jgi:plasmid maintenance system antidote protein VapI